MINIAIVDDNRVDLAEEVQITEEYFRKRDFFAGWSHLKIRTG
ncbi:MAG: hypothetical protein PUE72_11520 [Lachnospiraceae bacterium]|nr:hypothetical protein [Lachnospiraceae bacterium]